MRWFLGSHCVIFCFLYAAKLVPAQPLVHSDGMINVGLTEASLPASLPCLMATRSSAQTCVLHHHAVFDWRQLLAHARGAVGERNVVYFYSNGSATANRGAEVIHQLHRAVLDCGIESYIEKPYQPYCDALGGCSAIEVGDTSVFNRLTSADTVVVTAISHGLDKGSGYLGTPWTGISPQLFAAAAALPRLLKWQIGVSYPSKSYYVDHHHEQICDTFYLADVMGCAPAAVLRAPPVPAFYDYVKSLGGGAVDVRPFSDSKRALLLYDDDTVLDFEQLKKAIGQLHGEVDEMVAMKLQGLSQQQMMKAYSEASVIVDLWLPGAETVSHEAILFDVIVVVADELNGKDHRDFPIPPEYRVSRDASTGRWNYTQLAGAILKGLLDYDNALPKFDRFKHAALSLPALFSRSVCDYFDADLSAAFLKAVQVLYMAAPSTASDLDMILPWALSVLLLQPHATLELILPDPIAQGINIMAALHVLHAHGFRRSILLSPRRPPLDCSRSTAGSAHFCHGMFQLTPMQSPRSYVCYSSASGLLLKPLSTSHIMAVGHNVPHPKSHMSCGEWANPATIIPVDDKVMSFTSVEDVEAAAAGGDRQLSADVCDAWKRLSESTLWISSWADFPKAAKDVCYTIMSLCDQHWR